LECPNCNGLVVSPEGQNGEKVCSICGLVLHRIPIARETTYTHWNPEWHSNWHQQDSETLKDWLTILRIVSCQLNLPTFPYKEEAARRIRKEKSFLSRSQKFGKNKRATVAALVYDVLRQYNKNRSIKDICKQLSLDSRLVTKQAWRLKKIQIINHSDNTNMSTKTTTDYLFNLGGRMITNRKLLIEAEEILWNIKRPGGNPVALAAGALYYVCKKKTNITKEQIAEAFNISHRTVYTNEARIRKNLNRMSIQMQSTVEPRNIAQERQPKSNKRGSCARFISNPPHIE
jgi:transcription initiation factor TFIIIB Brf1 subunit/transcription initiation factor TFIIB